MFFVITTEKHHSDLYVPNHKTDIDNLKQIYKVNQNAYHGQILSLLYCCRDQDVKATGSLCLFFKLQYLAK